MQRRDFLKTTTVAGAAIGGVGISALLQQESEASFHHLIIPTNENKLTPPKTGKIPVAFLITNNVTMIDYAGPWEVFQDVHVASRGENHDDQMPFQLFTVSDTTEVVIGTAGLKIVPNYTYLTAPTPKVIVIPAQAGRSDAMFSWLSKVTETADVVMSVCTGAFILAKAGLLNGKTATTHHDFLDRLSSQFPEVKVKRGLRFVEGPKISTAGGLTSGIDLALRVVDRYFGRDVAQATATYMEYQSNGWVLS
jgi:transcriptional regulator GlxA family with amidase domain